MNEREVHPKLHNINLHNVTHSLMSRNPREWIFVLQISLIYCHISLPYITQFVINATTKEVNPHPHLAICVNLWIITFFFFLCHLLKVGACVRHIAREGQVEWTTLA